jgi:hypothetical protein
VTASEAIKIIKSECYVFNPLNFDRTQLINTALDAAVEALEQVKEIKGIVKDKRYIQEDVLKYKMICEVIEK